VPTDKQRREAARRHLERQVQRRAEREQQRKKMTLITSIVGTIALIAAVVVIIAITNGGKKTNSTASQPGTSAAPSTTPATTSAAAACGSASPTPTTYPAAKGASVTFNSVTVKGATDLKGIPGVTAAGKADPSKLLVKDLVVGTGKAATPTSCVDVQYYGVLYKNGKYFDSSWKRGATAEFSLTGVVPGFTQGIGGGSGIPPMKEGGRRIMIVPSAMGYGATGSPPAIPANSPLVFVVDLVKVVS
jgi:peptidylprolyl isomerase